MRTCGIRSACLCCCIKLITMFRPPQPPLLNRTPSRCLRLVWPQQVSFQAPKVKDAHGLNSNLNSLLHSNLNSNHRSPVHPLSSWAIFVLYVVTHTPWICVISLWFSSPHSRGLIFCFKVIAVTSVTKLDAVVRGVLAQI